MKIGVRYLLERSIVHMVKEKSPLQGSVVTLDHQKFKCRLIIEGKKDRTTPYRYQRNMGPIL